VAGNKNSGNRTGRPRAKGGGRPVAWVHIDLRTDYGRRLNTICAAWNLAHDTAGVQIDRYTPQMVVEDLIVLEELALERGMSNHIAAITDMTDEEGKPDDQ